uniref:Uncharacterized protein n=1 Tax=Fagus sylvatica TaxID=28930 RepID=A0A2N9HE51_FAGSY
MVVRSGTHGPCPPRELSPPPSHSPHPLRSFPYFSPLQPNILLWVILSLAGVFGRLETLVLSLSLEIKTCSFLLAARPPTIVDTQLVTSPTAATLPINRILI